MAPSKQCISRLQKELRALQKSPDTHFAAAPDAHDILTWRFVFDGPADTPYAGGRYVGKIVFPPEYPFKPPDMFMSTPSGRLQVNAAICTTNTSFHPESWSPMWSVSTIITGFISFFTSEDMSVSSMTTSTQHRIDLAQKSRAFNAEHLKKTYGQTLPEEYAKDCQLLSPPPSTNAAAPDASADDAATRSQHPDDSERDGAQDANLHSSREGGLTAWINPWQLYCVILALVAILAGVSATYIWETLQTS